MLRRVLQQAYALPRGSGACAGVGSATRQLQALREVHAGAYSRFAATAEDVLSSGKAPSSSPPDDPVESTHDFGRLADLYLGGLWEKMQAGLSSADEAMGFDAEIGEDSLKVSLPDGGRISIRKDPDNSALVVHTNLHDFYGSDGADSEVPFTLQRDHTWETDGEELHQFLEDGLAKHLKLQLNLEPDSQNIYGPDPT